MASKAAAELLAAGEVVDENRRKEEFSNAFIQAISAAAGFSATKPAVDDDSVDWTLAQRGGEGLISSPRLDLQLKSTSKIRLEKDAKEFSYPLKKKNYNELRRTNLMIPRILVVVLLPDTLGEWIEQTEDYLLLRHCAYWKSLRGLAETSNDESFTVKMPMEQRFTVKTLQKLMKKVSNQDYP